MPFALCKTSPKWSNNYELNYTEVFLQYFEYFRSYIAFFELVFSSNMSHTPVLHFAPSEHCCGKVLHAEKVVVEQSYLAN